MDYKKESRKTIASIILLITITCVACYFLYNYLTEKRDNTGTITYYYTESSNSSDKSITLKNAEIETDETGKLYTSIGKVFNFKVVGNSETNKDIDYEVVVTKNTLSTINSKYVKIYLTTIDENGVETSSPLTEIDGNIQTYNDLTTSKLSLTSGKKVYTGTISKDAINYEQNFKLRIWIDDKATEDFDDESFNLKINVYSTDANVIEQSSKTITASSEIAFQAGEQVTLVDGSTYRVLTTSEEGIGTVTLFSDYNLDEDGEQDMDCSIINFKDCSSIYNTDQTSLLNDYNLNIKESLNDKSVTVRLATKEELDKLILNTSNYLWIYSTNYWTSSNSENNKIYTVDGVNNTIIDSDKNVSDYYGVRPVIEVSKNHIIVN